MTIRSISSVLVLLFASSLMAQYNGPESVEYDPVGDRYFVSNTGNGKIRQQDQAGVVTDFVTVSPAPYGLEIMGDTLFACSGGSVKGYLLSDGSQVFNRNVGGSFLNGITTDGSFIYVTDFSNSTIIKVDVANNTHTTLVPNTSGTPNGIVWDAFGDRLVVVFWGSNAPIKAYDRNTGASTTLVTGTGVSNIDGVAIDCHGNFVIASWSPDRITSYDPTFAVATDLGVPGLTNPADLDFDTVHGRICIPNTSSNNVILFEVDCSTGISETNAQQIIASPSPTDHFLNLFPALVRAEPYLLLDARGLLVGGGTLNASSTLDVSQLSSGLYILMLTSTNTGIRFVRK